MLKRLLVLGPTLILLSACATHVHTRYPTWAAYKAAHPKATYVVVDNKPAKHRTCWRVRAGWRCVRR